MALSLLDKAKQYFASKSQDNEGWFRQGQFTPVKQLTNIGSGLINEYKEQQRLKFGDTSGSFGNQLKTSLPGQVEQKVKNIFSSLSTPEKQSQFNQIPVTNLSEGIRAHIKNNYIAPIAQVPYNLKQTFGKDKTLLQRGAGALGTLGGTIAMIPDPIGDVVYPLYNYWKGQNQATKQGASFSDAQKAGAMSMIGHTQVGLGDAISNNSTVQNILNLAELPLSIFAVGKISKTRAGKNVVLNNEKQIIEAVNGISNLGSMEKNFANITVNKAERLAKQLIPGIENNKEVQQLKANNPDMYLKTIQTWLYDTLQSARDPKWSFGNSIRKVNQPPQPIKTGEGDYSVGLNKDYGNKVSAEIEGRKMFGKDFILKETETKLPMGNVEKRYQVFGKPQKNLEPPLDNGIKTDFKSTDKIDLFKKTVGENKFNEIISNYGGENNAINELQKLGLYDRTVSPEDFIKKLNISPIKTGEINTKGVGGEGVPKTVRVWNKSKFSNDGAYTNIPVIRKEENITLYQGSKPGENRQFWTSDKKYAEQFGEVREKTGTFYKVDNGNRVTDVYVEAPVSPSKGVGGEIKQPTIKVKTTPVGNQNGRIDTSVNLPTMNQEKSTRLVLPKVKQGQVQLESPIQVLKIPEISPSQTLVNNTTKQPTIKIKGQSDVLTGDTPKQATIKIQTQQPSSQYPSSSKIQTKGETTSIEQKANQLQQKSPKASSLTDIIQREPINVKQKVGILDYIRTPDRVLKKIGLEKEAQNLRYSYEKYINQLPKEIDKITDWSKQVGGESNTKIFKYLDGQKVQLDSNELRVAGEIKDYLSGWADKLGLPKDKRITNYITHIFDKDFIQKEFDPDVAKLIQNRVAGSVYDPFVEQRLGKMGYVEDTWRALDAYVKRATRKVNMDPALNSLKNASKDLETSQYDYVKKYVDRINMRPTNLENLVDNSIKQMIGYRLGQRPTSLLTRGGRQAVYRGALGLNFGSALRNLTQGANTYAKLGEKYTVKGYWDILTKGGDGIDELKRVGVLADDMIQDRTLSASKQLLQNIDKGLFYFFETAEKINRGSAYFGAKSKALSEGMNEEQAINFAKKIVRDTQFTFGRIDTPLALQDDITKLLTQFQSFTIKQGEFLGEMAINKDIAGLIRYGLANMAMIYSIGQLIGMEPKDMIPSLRFSAPPTLATPIAVGEAVLGVPDKYGNVPDTQEKINKIGKTLLPYIPAGVQLNKTIQGIRAVGDEGSYSKSGRLQYPVEKNTENYIRAGLFGKNNLPSAREYFNSGNSVLGEKQTELYKQSNDKIGLYKTIISDRQQNSTVEKLKDKVKQTGESGTAGNKYIYYKDGEVKTIDLTFDDTSPKLTGNTELDKKKISTYSSSITRRINDIVELNEQGQMEDSKAEAEILRLLQLQKEAKAKTTKKSTKSKGGKITIAKVTTPTIKKFKLPTIKLPNTSLKSNIKIKKPSITQLKKRRTIKIKV